MLHVISERIFIDLNLDPPLSITLSLLDFQHLVLEKCTLGRSLSTWELNILKIKAYKLGKIIENKKIDVQITYEQVKATKVIVRKSLKRRKEMSIQQNDTQCK